MAPDRGDGVNDEVNGLDHEASEDITDRPVGQEPSSAFLAKRSEQPQFTIRALLLGLLIGVLIAFSNTYFGLQTGWISGMAMPSALVGFAYFRGLRSAMARLGDGFKRYGLGEGFSEVENVLVQTVAGSVGTMPLGCGFVGVIPALEFLLKPSETPESNSTDPDIISALALGEERGGVRLPLGKLIIWALGLCFFGVVLAVPLRKQVIVREKLRFPSGTATALMIGVLHGGEKTGEEGNIEQQWARERRAAGGDGDEESRALIANASPPSSEHDVYARHDDHHREDSADKKDWLAQIRLLLYAFLVSGIYVSTIPRIWHRPSVVLTLHHRHWCRISSLSYIPFLSWARISLRCGFGISTPARHTWGRALSWARRRPSTCSLAPYWAGLSYHHWPNSKAGRAAM